MNRRSCVHESNTAEFLIPGCLVARPWFSNPVTGVRFAPGSQFFDNFEFPSSSNGWTRRSERGNRGSSPREGAGAMVGLTVYQQGQVQRPLAQP